jgi:hypothetical protein
VIFLKQKPFGFANEPEPLFLAQDAPQTDSLPRIRMLVAAIEAGVATQAAFEDATGLKPRHVL